MNTTNYFKNHGPQLMENGYGIIPIKPGQKYPSISKWPEFAANDDSFNQLIEQGHANHGVGIKTANTPAVDIDVHDASIVEKLVDWCKANIGETVQRIGQAPKALLVFRTEKPFKKLLSNAYTDKSGKTNRIEILGQGQQFVAFATHPTTKRPYQWSEGASLMDVELKDLPLLTVEKVEALFDYYDSIVPSDWQLISSGSKRAAHNSTEETGSMVDEVSPKCDVSIEKIQDTLSKIASYDYHDWIKVGMGLYHQFDGNEQGFELWDGWSAKSSNYDNHDMRKRWKSFELRGKGKAPVTFASVLHLAKEQDIPDNVPNSLEWFLENTATIENGNRIAFLNRPSHLAIRSFKDVKNSYKHVRVNVPAPTKSEPDREKSVDALSVYETRADRIQLIDSDFYPGKDIIFRDADNFKMFNTYREPFYEPTLATDRLQPYWDHLDYICRYDNERKWYRQWQAFNLLFPAERCKVTPYHISEYHGTGRGWIVELMEALMGYWNVTKTTMESLSGHGNRGQYNEYVDGSTLCFVEETQSNCNTLPVFETIRSLLTDRRIEVNKKYEPKRTQRIFTNFGIMGNGFGDVRLPENDRRINVLTGPDHVKDDDYYLHLYRWLGDREAIRQAYHWLKRTDMSDFNWQRSMETVGRRKLVDSSRSPLECYFREFIKAPPSPVLMLRQVEAEILALAGHEDAINALGSAKQLEKLLKTHGRGPFRLKYRGKAVTVWYLDKTTPEMANADIVTLLDKYESKKA